LTGQEYRLGLDEIRRLWYRRLEFRDCTGIREAQVKEDKEEREKTEETDLCLGLGLAGLSL